MVRFYPVKASILVLNCLVWQAKTFVIGNARISTMPKFMRIPKTSIASRLLCTSVGSNNNNVANIESKQWSLSGFKQEVVRRQLRAFKKVEKAHEKLRRASEAPQTPPTTDSESSTSTCISPINLLRKELSKHEHILDELSSLDVDLKTIKSTKDPAFQDLLPAIVKLGIEDKGPERPVRAPKLREPEVVGPRLPYYKYNSIDGIPIRVGRSAADNDELSCNREHRNGDQWWMHVAGSPGSHVVICSNEDDLLRSHKQTVMDAAFLTAIHSKANQSGRVQVTLTRCRNVSKPAGAKAGLVQLRGNIHTVTVDIKAESKRRERLQRL